jgi:hypothetical protein
MEDKRGTKRERSPSAGGKSFARRCRNYTTSTIRISAITEVPVGSLVVPPLLTGVRAGQHLREDPNA